MAYTTIDKPDDYFNTKLYTGTGATQSITGVGFQPDFVWIKSRTSTHNNQTFDVLKGVQKSIVVNENSAEITMTNGLTAFNSDGFTIGSDDQVNNNTQNFASWNWLGANASSSNTDGSITSSVSANTDAGFSIVSYTGTFANATVGHGLGVAPKVIILKNRDTTNNWCVGHGSIGFTKHLALNTTDASASSSVRFQDTDPTSTVYSVGVAGETNGSGNDIIAYCFAEKKGYSKFGSYTGIASSDSNFVYLGFKPSFLLIKNTSTSGTNWHIYDNKRLGYNVDNNMLRANLDNASQTDDDIDLLSNGFKLRRSTSALNNSGDNFIYLAFAENPFVTSSGVPACAR